ncbi:hypothetical protein VHEMI01212 [[Torrubiella] hemipterigena]|uniref:Tat pathway signal sequence n=1 Tax=[Torrubiella] hemipterigena TaxID=1531966 RepID=A0A0A1T460_9HYPO|nr:hypothetical protein VHEMI01212 [[Torrubiella] hemipterigena]
MSSFEDEASPRDPFLKNEVDTEFNSLPDYSPSQAKQRAAARARTWPLIFSTAFFAFSTAVLLFRLHTGTGSYANKQLCVDNPRGLPLGPEENYRGIDMTFTGALTWNSSGDLINDYVPGQRRWSGPPTPNMDEAWDGLEEFWTVLLEGDEADNVRDQTLLQNGYWVTGLDVFHQLHCLDSLRRATYPEFYEHEGTPDHWHLHIDHCVDYLRQAIMCHGDTSPMTFKWHASAQRYGPDFASTRFCRRRFDDIVDWSRARTPQARRGTTGKETAKNGINIYNDTIAGVDPHWLETHPERRRSTYSP